MHKPPSHSPPSGGTWQLSECKGVDFTQNTYISLELLIDVPPYNTVVENRHFDRAARRWNQVTEFPLEPSLLPSSPPFRSHTHVLVGVLYALVCWPNLAYRSEQSTFPPLISLFPHEHEPRKQAAVITHSFRSGPGKRNQAQKKPVAGARGRLASVRICRISVAADGTNPRRRINVSFHPCSHARPSQYLCYQP